MNEKKKIIRKMDEINKSKKKEKKNIKKTTKKIKLF